MIFFLLKLKTKFICIHLVIGYVVNLDQNFKKVLNVVNRLLELIKPKDIFLGQKDFQQLLLIKKHIIKNKINTVNSIKTIRSKGLLPYSSRNFNLNESEKKFALKVFNVIKKEKKLIKKNTIKK